MAHKYAEIAFTSTVKKCRRKWEVALVTHPLSPGQTATTSSEIEARDSFYIASVSETGWPYIQHRGGPAGFLKVIDQSTIGFADYSGNRQYVTTGNVLTNDRVALFLMDYPNRRRLKLLGRMALVGPESSSILDQLQDDSYKAQVERGMIIRIEAFDWNCPQHITPRYTQSEVDAFIESMGNQG